MVGGAYQVLLSIVFLLTAIVPEYSILLPYQFVMDQCNTKIEGLMDGSKTNGGLMDGSKSNEGLMDDSRKTDEGILSSACDWVTGNKKNTMENSKDNEGSIVESKQNKGFFSYFGSGSWNPFSKSKEVTESQPPPPEPRPTPISDAIQAYFSKSIGTSKQPVEGSVIEDASEAKEEVPMDVDPTFVKEEEFKEAGSRIVKHVPLNQVQVNKKDAKTFEELLDGELIQKFEEKFEVMQARGISKENTRPFINHMGSSYEGIDDEMAKYMKEDIDWDGDWSNLLLEFNGNTDQPESSDNSYPVSFGMLSFNKDPSDGSLDCRYVVYKMDMKLDDSSNNLMADGGNQEVSMTTVDKEEIAKQIKKTNIQNFFRAKALMGFYKEGLIDRINWVEDSESSEKEY